MKHQLLDNYIYILFLLLKIYWIYIYMIIYGYMGFIWDLYEIHMGFMDIMDKHKEPFVVIQSSMHYV